jgi:hypothetical protein
LARGMFEKQVVFDLVVEPAEEQVGEPAATQVA